MFASRLLPIIFFVFLAAPVHAQSDSVSVGLEAVEDFYTEVTALVRGFGDERAAEEFNESSLDRTNAVAAEIRSMGWLEAPGRRRYNLVYDAFSEYADGQIESVRGLGAGLSPERKGPVDEAVERLTRLKKEKLARIAGTLEFETFRKKRPKPVPIMESTPLERNRGEREGIYFR